MTRFGFCLLAAILLSACAATEPDKSITMSMTHHNEITLPVIVVEAPQPQNPLRCEQFLANIEIAERKTASLYGGYAL